jgi:acyl carrier protein
MNTIDEINREIEQIVNAETGSIKGTEALSDIGWDSMASVMFIAMSDEKFAKAIPPDALAQAKVVSDLHALLATH